MLIKNTITFGIVNLLQLFFYCTGACGVSQEGIVPAVRSNTTLLRGAKIIKMAISAASDNNQTKSPIPPCGGCRQSISEYEFKQNTPIEIYFMGETGEVYKSDSIKNLLPLSFDKNFL